VSNKREFITLLGGAAAGWPLAVFAQQSAMPVIGFLRSTTAADAVHLLGTFRQGLSELGFVEGQNVAIEYRSGAYQTDQLPALAADLVRHQVAVIVATDLQATLEFKATTKTAGYRKIQRQKERQVSSYTIPSRA